MSESTRPLIYPALSRPARKGTLSVLTGLMALHRQRRRLAELPDHLLEDVGLTRKTAQKEAERPLWDAPGHWHR